MAILGWRLQTIPIVDATFSGKKHCGIPSGSWTDLLFYIKPIVNFGDTASARRWRRLRQGYEQALGQVVGFEPQAGSGPILQAPYYGGGVVAEGMVIPAYPYSGGTWCQLDIGAVVSPVSSPDDDLDPSNFWWNLNVTKGVIGGSFACLVAWGN